MQLLVKQAGTTMRLAQVSAVRARLDHEEPGHLEVRLWSQVYKLVAREHRGDYNIALVGGYVTAFRRRKLAQWAKQNGFDRVVAVYCKVRLAQCLTQPGPGVTEDAAQAMYDHMVAHPPTLADGFDEIVTVEPHAALHAQPSNVA
jgi:hypothetical protein